MKTILLNLFLFFASLGFSQIVMKMSDANKKLDRDSLQQLYFDRIFTDEISTCFDVSQETFIDEWMKYTRSIGKFLHDKNFVFGKRLTANIELFFDESERVTILLVDIKDPEFKEERYSELFTLLEEFCKTHPFKVLAKIPFSNFGTVHFTN